jgi:hypothetical protein
VIGGFAYLPRAEAGNGTIARYELYISDDARIGASRWRPARSNLARASRSCDSLRTVSGRYVRLRALSEVRGQRWASAAGLRPLVDGVEFRARRTVHSPWHHADGTPKSEREREYTALLRDLRRGRALRPRGFRDVPPPVADPLQRPRPGRHRSAADRGPAGRPAAMPGGPDLHRAGSGVGHPRRRQRGRRPGRPRRRYELFERVCDCGGGSPSPIRCWTSTACCSSSGTGRRSTTCATSTTASTPTRAARWTSAFPHGAAADEPHRPRDQRSGLFILEDPFGPDPQVTDVLAESVVERGGWRASG